jgi:hypothetical protein
LITDITLPSCLLDRRRTGIDGAGRKMKRSFFARLRSWFLRERAPAVELEVTMPEDQLFEAASEPASDPNESGVRLKTAAAVQVRGRLPALQLRNSPFDAATRKVDVEELAKAIESSSRAR